MRVVSQQPSLQASRQASPRLSYRAVSPVLVLPSPATGSAGVPATPATVTSVRAPAALAAVPGTGAAVSPSGSPAAAEPVAVGTAGSVASPAVPWVCAGSVAASAAAPAAVSPSAAATPLLRCTEVGSEINDVAVSPDGRRAALALQDNTVHIWELESPVLVFVLRGHRSWVNHVAYAPNGMRVASASADKTVKLWNARNGECEATLSGHILAVVAVAFSPDSRRLVSGSWDKAIYVWDVTRGNLGGQPILTLSGHTDWVHTVAWSPGGATIASASSDNSVRVWNASTGAMEQVLVGHLQTVTSVSFARSGLFLASGSLDGTVRVWNLQESSLIATMHPDGEGGGAAVHCVAFCPDGERVLVACGDRSILVWNFRSGAVNDRLLAHEDAVLGVGLTRDGSRAASCGRDKTLRVWQLSKHLPSFMELPFPLNSSSLHRSSGSSMLRTACSMRELGDRLRSSEDLNQSLKKQLSEAEMWLPRGADLDSPRLAAADAEALEVIDGAAQRRRGSKEDLFSHLVVERERMERSFQALKRELRQPSPSPGPDGREVRSALTETGYSGASGNGGHRQAPGNSLPSWQQSPPGSPALPPYAPRSYRLSVGSAAALGASSPQVPQAYVHHAWPAPVILPATVRSPSPRARPVIVSAPVVHAPASFTWSATAGGIAPVHNLAMAGGVR
eukprot:TRINITY_DN24136_c0_g2_i2.p1 TRINITY_DN24136_c0_g2~~TRINITY_DN24136_c0_g2_i2.p1  ORF type:complete len:678 (-),score=136.07 TRINITY_DN24136_c0_g2_i2:124-2157(-)